MQTELGQPTICVVGLGYVGLPLATAFSRHFKVIGFDTAINRVKDLELHNDNQGLVITDDPQLMKQADFILITVPTPVTPAKEPDISHIISAARTINQNMKAGCTVVLESTVYPGVTEEVLKPVLEESGLQCGKDFKIAYSPESINPGDEEHTLDKVTKLVGGMDEETTEVVARLYSIITPHTFKTKNIKTAEAAKVIENIQRDLNIALVNEFSLIFAKLGLNTKDILDAAATKWNFNRYSPGLVGGHCIPVDPYYLVHKAREVGYYPQIILAGRSLNDSMPKYVAERTIKGLNDVGKVIKGSRVLIMGLTYKENVDDTRETPARAIIRELREYGVEVLGYDPLLGNIQGEFGINAVINFQEAPKIDGVIITLAHSVFREITLDKLRGIMNDNPVLTDVRVFFDQQQAEKLGFYYIVL